MARNPFHRAPRNGELFNRRPRSVSKRAARSALAGLAPQPLQTQRETERVLPQMKDPKDMQTRQTNGRNDA